MGPVKVLFDTSVLIAGVIESHPAHERAFAWFRRVTDREVELFVAAHSLAEFYAVLTRLPVSPKISPTLALRLLRENIEAVAHIVPLVEKEYLQVQVNMAELELAGGVVYDAIIAAVAPKSNCDALLTLNRRDFIRVWPEGKEYILEP